MLRKEGHKKHHSKMTICKRTIKKKYFFFRTLAETAMAAGLLAWLILFGVPAIKLDEIIYCETHGYLFECAGHPQVCKKFG
jgi:hypothetical protein